MSLPVAPKSAAGTRGEIAAEALIFLADGSSLQRAIVAENVEAVLRTGDGESRCQQFFLVEPGETLSQPDPALAPVPFTRCPSLGASLRQLAAGVQIVTVVSGGSRHPGESQPGLLPACREGSVVAWFGPNAIAGNLFLRGIAWLCRIVQRIVFQTGKNGLNRGAVSLHRRQVESIQQSGIECSTVDQLICACRATGARISETRVDDCDPDPTIRTAGEIWGSLATALRFWWQQIAFPAKALAGTHQPQAESGVNAHWVDRQRTFATAGLLAVAALVLFSNLDYPLFEPDEARNAQIALNLLDSGNWLSLTLDGEPYWDKPPLQAWLTAASYSCFGPGEAATRLPVAVCSWLTVAAVLLLGSRLINFRTAWFAAGLLLISAGFSAIGRYVTTDATLTLLATVMGLATLLGTRGDRVRRGWMAVGGIACGLGILTKGPVILVLVLPPLLLEGWLRGASFFRTRRFWLWSGVPAFLISGPWFLATGIACPEFLVYFFWRHNVIRFSEAFNHNEPWWYYLPVLVLMTYPACFLFPGIAGLWPVRERMLRQAQGPAFPSLLLGTLWVVLFFSLSEAKLPTYILPAIPLLSLMFGRTLDVSLRQNGSNPLGDGGYFLRSQMALSTAIMVAVTGLAGVLLTESGRTQNLVFGLSALGLALPLLWLATRRATEPALGWTGAIGIAALLAGVCMGVLVPEVSKFRSVHAAVARKAHEAGFEDQPILYFGVAPDASEFLVPESDIVSFDAEESDQAAEFLTEHPESILVTSKDNARSLASDLRGRVRIQKDPSHRKIFLSSRSSLIR